MIRARNPIGDAAASDVKSVTTFILGEMDMRVETIISTGLLTIRVADLMPSASDALKLNALTLNGSSVIASVANPECPQLASRPLPGQVSGSGRVVSALTEALEVGSLYLVSHEILADGGTTSLYFSDTGGCPFPNAVTLPYTVGKHHILVAAKDTDTTALMRLVGNLTFGYVSCRKAEWELTIPAGSDGAAMDWDVTSGTAYSRGRVYVPEPGKIYVSPTGSDTFGTGSVNSPFRQPLVASAIAKPGDTIYLHPGV